MTPETKTRSPLAQLERGAMGLGLAALALTLAGAFFSGPQFYRSYLFAYLFWAGMALGCLALLMLQYLTGGGWGLAIRRILEAGTRTLPLVAVLFVPVALGMKALYVWAQPEAVAADELLQHKAAYLNAPFFLARAGFYFAVWLGLAWLLHRGSLAEERGEAGAMRRLRVLSAPGLIAYGLTATFASVDWVMSLEPHWFSTIYGVLFIVGQALAALALAVVVLQRLSGQPPLKEVVTRGHFHDLGNLLFAFVMLWAYVSFSQFLIIWSGNLPEETPWYLHRLGHGWQWISLALVVFHFAVPFLLLLSRRTKRAAATLAMVAIGLLLMRAVDLFWLVMPNFYGDSLRVHWLDVTALAGIGGVWVAMFARQLGRLPLIPQNDPRLAEAMEQVAEARH